MVREGFLKELVAELSCEKHAEPGRRRGRARKESRRQEHVRKTGPEPKHSQQGAVRTPGVSLRRGGGTMPPHWAG